MLCFGTTMSSHDILPLVSPIGVYQSGTGSDVAPSFLSQSNLFLSGRFHLDYKQLNTLKTDTYYMVDFLLTLISWLCPPQKEKLMSLCQLI
jgi:hypothetical protein